MVLPIPPRLQTAASGSSRTADRAALTPRVSSAPTLDLTHRSDDDARHDAWHLEQLWPGSRLLLIVGDHPPTDFPTTWHHLVDAVAARALAVEVHGSVTVCHRWERDLRHALESRQRRQAALW